MNRTWTLILTLLAAIAAGAGSPAESSDKASVPPNQELAKLLVKLELRTRGVIAGHYAAADEAHRDWLARDVFLPAAVADAVFHATVPESTGGRAWVRMVVDEPRNPNNAGDDAALALLGELRRGKPSAERQLAEAYYYSEPIKAVKTCLVCHGSPRGEADPYFPKYKKEGWKEGDIVGAVVARVADR